MEFAKIYWIGAMCLLALFTSLHEAFELDELFQLCGHDLTHALGELCNHRYAHPIELDDNGNIAFSKKNDPNLNEKHQGIIQECCHQACSVQNLLLYCLDDGQDVSSFLETYRARSQPTAAVIGQELTTRTNSLHPEIEHIPEAVIVRNSKTFRGRIFVGMNAIHPTRRPHFGGKRLAIGQ